MRKSLIFSSLLIISITAFCQSPAPTETSKVKWYTLQEAEKLTRQDPRPMFIDTFTDWCGWCKKMDKETFTNSVISEILNSRYYPVKFNAEGKDSITFFGKKFINDGRSGNAHQLAVALLNGQLSYPTVVFLIPQKDGNLQVSQVPGFKQPKDMEVLLNYFADKAYISQKFDDFQKTFQGRIK